MIWDVHINLKPLHPLYLVDSLQQVLLQSEEDLMAKRSSERTETAIEGAAPKSKQLAGKMKVQGNACH